MNLDNVNTPLSRTLRGSHLAEDILGARRELSSGINWLSSQPQYRPETDALVRLSRGSRMVEDRVLGSRGLDRIVNPFLR